MSHIFFVQHNDKQRGANKPAFIHGAYPANEGGEVLGARVLDSFHVLNGQKVKNRRWGHFRGSPKFLPKLLVLDGKDLGTRATGHGYTQVSIPERAS